MKIEVCDLCGERSVYEQSVPTGESTYNGVEREQEHVYISLCTAHVIQALDRVLHLTRCHDRKAGEAILAEWFRTHEKFKP